MTPPAPGYRWVWAFTFTTPSGAQPQEAVMPTTHGPCFNPIEIKIIKMPGNTDESGFYFKDIRIEKWGESTEYPLSIVIVRVPYYGNHTLILQDSNGPFVYDVEICLCKSIKRDTTFEGLLEMAQEEQEDITFITKSSSDLDEVVHTLSYWRNRDKWH